jgi:carbon-monoxide dehydrogenase medium subunit
MKASDFTYHAPRTLDEAMGLVGRLDNAKLLAGGQSLMPMVNLRLAAPDHLIDINRIDGLAGLRIKPGRIEIGAMTRQADLQTSAELAAVLPIFRETLAHVGHMQTRARGTIGGSCCHLDPAAELPAICALLDAEFDVVGPQGARTIQAHDWFQGYLQSAIDEHELLCAIRLKPWTMTHGYGFNEYARRRGDFAIAGAGAMVELGTDMTVGRIALVVFGVASEPIRLAQCERALIGRPLDHAAIATAVAEARAIDAMGDVHVSADYRRRLAGIVTQRALAQASHNAGATK